MTDMLNRILAIVEKAIYVIVFIALLNFSNPPLLDTYQRVRVYTRQAEFDYVSWTINAAITKLQQGSVNIPQSLGRAEQKQITSLYLSATQNIFELENTITQIYSDPAIADKEIYSQDLRDKLKTTQARYTQLAPLAEAVLQQQIAQLLAQQDLTTWGQPIPSVLYHSASTPNALIISARDHIEQIASVSLDPDLTVDQKVDIENQVDGGMDVSSLIVGTGGIGVYPTMVMRTTNLPWLLNTIAHEWTHNYLTLHPLGALYTATPELRTMNETTASIVGDEIGLLALKEYYPELNAASSSSSNLIALPIFYLPSASPLNVEFDFRAEMHETRVRADDLLARGEIETAEKYMEFRRQVFWDNGYQIRKLNQAYFAFHGAYADVPGGAAGEDPVGPAVRALREQSASLADFLTTISWMTSFEQLQEAVNR